VFRNYLSGKMSNHKARTLIGKASAMRMELGMPPAEEWDRPWSEKQSNVKFANYLISGVLLLMISITAMLSLGW
jgi:hypothetical protein